jgi:hypothetical protein
VKSSETFKGEKRNGSPSDGADILRLAAPIWAADVQHWVRWIGSTTIHLHGD